MSKDKSSQKVQDILSQRGDKGRFIMITNAISVNVFEILLRLLNLWKSLHYIHTLPLLATRVLLKLEDPDVTGNDVLPIIKLQENLSNKNQLERQNPFILLSLPVLFPRLRCLPHRTTARLSSLEELMVPAHMRQSLMTCHSYLNFPPQSERQIKKFIN